MADHFYSISLGAQSVDDVTIGTSTGSTAVELRVTDATSGIQGNKAALLKLVKLIEYKIAEADAPA